jgi:hypothetical protein
LVFAVIRNSIAPDRSIYPSGWVRPNPISVSDSSGTLASDTAQKGKRPIRHAPNLDESIEEVGQSGEVRIRQSVIQATQVLAAGTRVDA